MRKLLVALVVLAFGLASAPGSTRSGLDRTTADQADDIVGPQVHAVYALPADGADRALDTNGTISASVRNWETWLRGQTGGHGLRLDTRGGAVDITFFRLPQSEADLRSRGVFLRDAIESALKSAGLTQPGKIYAVYYDGQSTGACGGGAYPPSLPGIVAAVYLPSTYWNSQGIPCYSPERSLNGIDLTDYAMLHELLHTVGIVPSCAPHHTRAGHVSDSPTDLMYAGDDPWRPSVLDVGRDDYFNAHVTGCQDLADSAYLENDVTFVLSVTVAGSTTGGTVTSAPSGIACGATCAAPFPRGTTVTLTAAPSAGSQFAGWGGACSGSVSTCTVSMDTAKAVVATFARVSVTPPTTTPKPKKKRAPLCKKHHKSTKKHPCRRR